MKKKSFAILSPLLAFIVYLSINSYSSGISGVSTGGCSCHNGVSSAATDILLSGLPTGGYQNGATYTLTLSVTNTTITGLDPKDGFDLNATGGEFTAGTGTQLFSSNEIGHGYPQSVVAGNATWTFTWTAPLTGNAAVTFNVAANATNGDGISGIEDAWNTYSTTLIGTGTPSSILELKLFLDGYYAGASLMNPVLLNQGVGSSFTITDSIVIELKDPLTFITAATATVGLATDGTAICDFGSLTGSYYIAISHRNGILTWSSVPVLLIAGSTTYDFTTNATMAYGDNMREVETGVWALYSGDLNHDENIDLLDIAIIELDISNFEFGYMNTDINGDGNVDLLDSPSLESNVSNFIFSNHP